ncbi:MAG: sulfatase-like hydrolase/transferase [Clostridia bacterium]|nr:sulfatase-like hydrolase/transferase [Clostridia bacterium]
MKHPNIVFILSDDQGYWSLGCTGNSEIITPNIDRLADEGTLMSNFFCASPVCSPARASLLTGTIPSAHGVHDWLRDDTPQQAAIEYLAGQYSYTRALSEAGYDCALSGKWHMGASDHPQQGFSHWFCHKRGGGPYYNAPMYRDGVLYEEPRYITDVITDDAISYLDSRAGKEEPFFLYVGYTAPHSPWLDNHPKEYTDLYENCPFDSVPHLADHPRHPDAIYLTDKVSQDERGNLIGYYAAVTAMDTNIGRILRRIDELGMREDTLVIFTADNGFSCGHHGFWGKGNATFPINLYEESVKVPFIARFPGRIPEGAVCDALVSAYDFMPTLLDFVGVPARDEASRPGRSFLPALTGCPFDDDAEVVVMDEYGPNRMIRTRDTKLIVRYPYGPDELYDLAADPGETMNLLVSGDAAARERARELRRRLEVWFARYADPASDGSRLPVTGSGQRDLPGTRGGGDAFTCDDYIRNHPNFAAFRAKQLPAD